MDRFIVKEIKTLVVSSILKLNRRQKLLLLTVMEKLPRPRKYDIFEILCAILYVLKSGCQWNMLPANYPPSKIVYHHFRSWSDRGFFCRVLESLVAGKRASEGRDPSPDICVIDSQSVRSGLCHSEKGIDGYKRIKGIKRHIVTDSCGYPLVAVVSTANEHDGRMTAPLMGRISAAYPTVRLCKADQGYRGNLERILPEYTGIKLECVKSNLGNSEFIPMQGRWVVERTFSWMESYRRLNRNYEKSLKVALHIWTAACVMFMLRYF